ncbi:DUF3667 domain-containing protein [Microbulbifer variabilis]|uniref:DUF3667 domain-containing protein n=1 Tax=Microbulbifer variabilis TaxID=266805 RepID=UPI001CFD8DA8|nr:DUF3667 domain-containing protein [Microbulbifer variabilis]
MDVRRSKIASAERSDYCANCNTILLGRFCHGCGQPVKGIVRNFYSVIYDFLNTLVAFDARIWRTLPALLLSPGFLTIEYLSGKRARYVSPAKLFIFLCVSAFFLILISSDWSIDTEYLATSEQTRDDTDFLNSGGQNGLSKESISGEPKTGKHFEWPLPGGRSIDFIGVGSKQEIWAISLLKTLGTFRNTVLSFGFLPQSGQEWFEGEFSKARQNVERVSKNPTILAKALFGALPSTLLFMLPIFAGMLWLCYFRQGNLYMEHIIVSMHSHAFLCLILLLETLTFWVEEWLEHYAWIEALCYGVMLMLIFWIPIYLLRMQKRVYAQDWGATLIKFFSLGIVYPILLMLGALSTAFYSLAEI